MITIGILGSAYFRKLEKILSTLEEKDDMVLNRKVDKIEKMLSRLGTNIEKLTSYVDED